MNALWNSWYQAHELELIFDCFLLIIAAILTAVLVIANYFSKGR